MTETDRETNRKTERERETERQTERQRARQWQKQRETDLALFNNQRAVGQAKANQYSSAQQEKPESLLHVIFLSRGLKNNKVE